MVQHDAGAGETQGGDLLQAYDALADGLAAEPDNIALRHRAVLLLARAGATRQAEREYERLGLAAIQDHEDILALGGRLLKDLALAATGEARYTHARAAAAKYAAAFNLHRGYYPGINTATMTLIAGDRARACRLAEQVLQILKDEDTDRTADAYYRSATAAEALFLLGRGVEAETALVEAIGCEPGNYASHATTLRQLEVIAAELGADCSWVERHRPPPAVMFCGHIFGPEPAGLAAALTSALDTLRPSAGFGSLAAGSDLAIAETLLTRGGELHVVLPMREDDFLRRSVAPFGDDAVQRYHACKHRASTFRLASNEPDMGDDAVFAFGSEFAMGLAIRHADMLATRAYQLAVWDGEPSTGVAGTAADVARWRTTGRPQTIIPWPQRARTPTKSPERSPEQRTLKAMLFGDIRGFSKLDENHIRPFVEKVLSPLAEALRAAVRAPDLVATWGDGIHMVFDSVIDAAEAAIAAQDSFSQLDLAGLPPHLALRIGGHFGPAVNLKDPFLDRPNFYGTHITIAARIEPVAAPGTIYVSEPFAALLALRAPGRFRTEYLGQTALPKQFGTMRLFSLQPNRPA